MLRRRFIPNAEIRLPDGYIRLNYVEATQQQYIRTGYVPSNTEPYRIVADFQFTKQSNRRECIFGKSNNSNNSGTFWFVKTPDGFYGFLRSACDSKAPEPYNTQPTSTVKFGSPNLARHVFEFIYKNGVYVDGVWIPELTEMACYDDWMTAISPNNDFGLFAKWRASSGVQTDSYANARLYDFAIYDSAGLARRFIPAQNADTGEIGMYEIVNGTFHTSETNTPLLGG